jgi:hypothetical protein
MPAKANYADQIANALKKAKINFDRERAIGGLRPDFTVYGPKNQVVIVEAKPWDPRDGNTARALNLVGSYQVATKADQAYLVLPKSSRNYSGGVVNVKGLIEALEEYFESGPPSKKKAKLPPRKPTRTIFAAMPFTPPYDDTFVVAISHAAEACRAVAQRVDHMVYSGSADAEARRLIKECTAVVVDLSEARPNVMYEAGYAEALKKPIAWICSTPRKDLPFNVRNRNIEKYHIGGSAALGPKLTRTLNKLIR